MTFIASAMLANSSLKIFAMSCGSVSDLSPSFSVTGVGELPFWGKLTKQIPKFLSTM